MKWKQRHFDCEPEKDSGKSEPSEFTREQSVFTETGERRKIECALSQINSEEGEQHRDASEEGVEEKLGRGVVAILITPDFDQQERGDQTHLVEQKPEKEILRRERAVR